MYSPLDTLVVDAWRLQASWVEASLAAWDKIGRSHETPEDAADRATEAARTGEVRSWYRKPPASWYDVSVRLAPQGSPVAQPLARQTHLFGCLADACEAYSSVATLWAPLTLGPVASTPPKAPSGRTRPAPTTCQPQSPASNASGSSA